MEIFKTVIPENQRIKIICTCRHKIAFFITHYCRVLHCIRKINQQGALFSIYLVLTQHASAQLAVTRDHRETTRLLVFMELMYSMYCTVPQLHEDGLCILCTTHWGTQWHSWLRYSITSWKVVVSIPDGVIGIFY
jgi:hypothetical protein